MSRIKIEAFVIRTTRLAESSRVVTLFSREAGKVKAVAKGVGRPKSKMSGVVELFNMIEGLLYKKEASELGTLGSASVIKDFPDIMKEPRKFGFGSAWCEILDKTSNLEEPRTAKFDLTLDYLESLKSAGPDVAGLLFWSGLIKLLAIEGYAPRINKCILCGKEKPGRRIAISLNRGGLVCAECVEDDEFIIAIDDSVLDLLRRMEREHFAQIICVSVGKKTGRMAAEVILSFASYHLGLPRNLKSFKFLEGLAE